MIWQYLFYVSEAIHKDSELSWSSGDSEKYAYLDWLQTFGVWCQNLKKPFTKLCCTEKVTHSVASSFLVLSITYIQLALHKLWEAYKSHSKAPARCELTTPLCSHLWGNWSYWREDHHMCCPQKPAKKSPEFIYCAFKLKYSFVQSADERNWRLTY